MYNFVFSILFLLYEYNLEKKNDKVTFFLPFLFFVFLSNRRQRERLIHPLEMAISENGQRTNIAQARFMVKEFSRSAAGHEIKASDIRPQPVLVKTLRYLLSK